ncbi:MAG: hypothetical protein OK454_00215 [Thaumarchaeota archaeon]|nr:hypothetical protein [Nitrososphaerota archaeon]
MKVKGRLTRKGAVELGEIAVVKPYVAIGKVTSCAPDGDGYYLVEIETEPTKASARIIDGNGTLLIGQEP